MAIKYRQELGRPLTYAEGDENFRTLEDSIEKTLAEYPTLTAAMADDIPDGVVFLVNDGDDSGYWRRDSSLPEGAEFLRRHYNEYLWSVLGANSVDFTSVNVAFSSGWDRVITPTQSTSILIPVEPGKKYRFHREVQTNRFRYGFLPSYPEMDLGLIGGESFAVDGEAFIASAPPEAEYMIVYVNNANEGVYPGDKYFSAVSVDDDSILIPSKDVDVKQETGSSETAVMSQKAVTDVIREVSDFLGRFTLEQGGISAVDGGPGSSDNLERVRTTLFKGPFSLKVNDDYAIRWAGAYDEDGEFIETLAGTSSLRRSLSSDSTHWIRVAFSRQGGQGNLSPSDDIIQTSVTGVNKKNVLTAISVGPANAINVNTNNETIELDSALISWNGFFSEGITGIVSYSLDTTASVILYDPTENSIEAVQPSGDYGTKAILGVIRSGTAWINGIYSIDGKEVIPYTGDNSGDDSAGDLSARNTYIIAGDKFSIVSSDREIKIEEGAYIFTDNTYDLLPPHDVDYSDVNASTRFIFLKKSEKRVIVTGESLGPVDEDKSLIGFMRGDNVFVNGSYTYNGRLISAGSDPYISSEKDAVVVNTRYEYEGAINDMPTSANDVYEVYDSLVEDFGQYVSKEVLGKSRTVITLNVDSMASLPITMRVDSVAGISEGMTVLIEDNDYTVEEVWENSVSSIGNHIKIKPTSEANIPPTGGIKTTGGQDLTTYSERRYSRYECYLNDNIDFKFFVVDADVGSLQLEGVFDPDTTGVPPTGTLTDDDGNVLASYSNLNETPGGDINCYTFDFSSGRRNENDVKNRLFFIGGVHGYEKRAMLGQMTFFRELCMNWRDSEELSALRNIRYTVIPVANPWGVPKNTNYNAHGVDLNRNFENGFNQTNAMYYRWSGYEPLSEPEAVIIKNKMEEVSSTTFALIDSHNDGSILGAILSPPFANKHAGNAISRNIDNHINRLNPQIPTYLWAWSSNGSTVWSLTQNPKQGDEVYIDVSSSDGAKTIDDVSTTSITVDGVNYSRNDSEDVDYTNLFRAANSGNMGTTVRQANAIGINEAFTFEGGGRIFMTLEEQLKLQIEMTTNVVRSVAKYFLEK